MKRDKTISQPLRAIRALIRLCSASVAAILTSNMTAWAEPVFSTTATEACVQQAATNTPSLSGFAVLDCVGLSAGQCMTTPGGDTTVGMVECFDRELRYWDGRLNAAYSSRMEAAKAEDKELAAIGATAASLEQGLRGMQRAWIDYRDAACLYEQAQWMGGTGGGPATMACHLHETARQALKLEGWWQQ